MRRLHVSAGGLGTRIQDFLVHEMGGVPKHLLPLRPDQTILDRIVLMANSFDQIVVHTGPNNHGPIDNHLGKYPQVRVSIDRYESGPLGPMIRELLQKNQRTYGCAGDFYCEFSWPEFERFHEQHQCPVSILVAPSVPTSNGARFLLGEMSIVSAWERIERTSENDLINIGAYIVDPDPDLLPALCEMVWHKEDPFFDMLIPNSKVAGYTPASLGFNVNTAEVYRQLIQYLHGY